MPANYLKYALINKEKLKHPAYLIFFLTNRCNLKCGHCFYWESLNTAGADKELTIKELEDFAKQLEHLEWLALSGGEPFLRKDIDEVVRVFREVNGVKQVTIPTNGMLPKIVLEKSESILKISPELELSLNLSIDGLEETHDYIRGVKGSFKKQLETYNLVKDLKGKYPNFYLRVNTAVCNRNFKELKQFDDFLKEEMPMLDSHNFEFMRGTAKDPGLSGLSYEDMRETIKLLHDLMCNYKFFTEKGKFKSRMVRATKMYLYNLYLKQLKNNRRDIKCYAGITHMVLDPLGDVYVCETLPNCIGNIRKNTFDEIWNGEKVKEVRDLIEAKKCWCNHSCFMNSNVVFNPVHYPGILKEALSV